MVLIGSPVVTFVHELVVSIAEKANQHPAALARGQKSPEPKKVVGFAFANPTTFRGYG
jgi:hypothetical protein